jgi:hypothetical protein
VRIVNASAVTPRTHHSGCFCARQPATEADDNLRDQIWIVVVGEDLRVEVIKFDERPMGERIDRNNLKATWWGLSA